MYPTEERSGVQIITCPTVIDGHDPSLEAQVKSWLLAPCDIHVLDMKETGMVKASAYRLFVTYHQQLKANGKHLFAMNLNPQVALTLKQEGLGNVFAQVGSIEDAKRKTGGSGLDVEFIKPFIAGTSTVLEKMAKVKTKPGRPYLRKPDENKPIDIAGIIALQAKEFTGIIAICFQAGVFLSIYESMVGERHEQLNAEIEDAAAEILNMIYGHAKTVLNDTKGYTIEKALPTVLSGQNLRLRFQNRAASIVLPFDSQAGPFHLEILTQKSGS